MKSLTGVEKTGRECFVSCFKKGERMVWQNEGGGEEMRAGETFFAMNGKTGFIHSSNIARI